MDLVALKADANRFLKPEDDSGHGWRLNHPIGKLIIFQAHLASRKHKAAPRTPTKPKAKAKADATPTAKRARRAAA